MGNYNCMSVRVRVSQGKGLGQGLFSGQVRETLKWVAAGVAVFGLVVIGKKLYSRLTNKKQQQEQPNLQHSPKPPKTPEHLNTKITEYSQFYFDKDLQIQSLESTLPENPSVQDIYLSSPTIARDEFIKYTRQMRKRRRLVRKSNQDQYINTVLMYQTEVQDLLFRSRMELIQYLGIQREVFQGMEENYQAIEDLRALNRKAQQLLKNKLITQTKQKPLSLQTLQKIIQQQLHFIHNNLYDRLRQKLQKQLNINQSEILLVVQTLMQDIIYEKFGYESQDVTRKIRELGYGSRELDQARRKMEIDIGDFNFDSLESLEDPDSVLGREEQEERDCKGSVKTVGRSMSDTSQV